MKTHHYIITAVSGYLFFLLLLTPAATVISFLKLPSNSIALSGISGSIWSGSIDQARIKQQHIDNIFWSLNPLSLLTGSISSELKADVYDNPVQADLDHSFFSKSTSLYNVSSALNAKDLQKKLNLPFGELAGKLQLNLSELKIKPKSLPSITGIIQWNNAQLTLADKISFGNILLTLTPDDQSNLTGKLSNTKGELIIKGQLSVSPKSIYTLNIGFKPRANASAELVSILKLIAPRKEKGQYVLKRSGHLRQLGIKL